MKRFSVLIIAAILMLIPWQSFAQDAGPRTITGTVLDEEKEPMMGVFVMVEGTKTGTATDAQGRYSIKARPDQVLTFQYIGYNDLKEKVGKRSVIDVTMYTNANELDQVVVIGYGSVKKADLTGSATAVDMKNLRDIPIASVDHALQGRVAGADIMSTTGEPGATTSIRIRGTRSITATNEPLIVVDGVIDGINDLNDINSADIASITILKDASSTAIYGARGANGVIVINTKRIKTMATRIDVNISGNYQLMPNLPLVMDEPQYRSYASELLGSTGTKNTTFKFLNTDNKYTYYYWYHDNNTDWSKIAYRDAFVQNYNISVMGGDDVANYSLSVGYVTGDAILDESDFSRFNLRLNSDISLGDRLSMRFDASYSDVIRDLRDDGAPDDIDNTMINSPGFLALVKSPFLSPYAHKYGGGLTNYLATEDEYLSEALGNDVSLANPLAILKNGDGINKNYFGSRLITLAVTPKFEIKRNNRLNLFAQFTYTLANSDENYYIPLDGTPRFRIEGLGMVDNKAAAMSAKQDGFMGNIYLDYNRRFNAHSVNLQGGFRYINNSMYQTSMLGYNSGNDKQPNMNTNLKYRDTDGKDAKDISLTWWGQANYNFMEKYYLTASLGLTASSRFGTDVESGLNMFGVPWGIFPSVSAAWVASSEPWFQVDFINHLKLSAGFDIAGNDGYDASASKTYFSPVRILGKSGVAMANIGNGALSWETTRKLTAGLDMVLLDNRIALSFNVFNSNTDNLLSIGSLSYVTGLPETWSNGGSLSNKGFDASINAKLINNKDFKWEAGAGIGHDLMLVVDNDAKKTYSVNEYFTSANDSYQQGQVSYLMNELADGPHTLTFRAWDLLNNSTTKSLNFVVEAGIDPSIYSVTTYPNPVRAAGVLNMIVHYDQPDELIQTQIYLYNTNGQVIWKQEQGNPDQVSIQLSQMGLQPGVYFYSVRIKSEGSKYAKSSGKIIVVK